MALRKSSVIPEDAIAFTNESEAAAYIWGIVNEWDSISQTWALRYGPIILGGINAVCGLVINKHFRTRFKLGQYGYLASSVPMCVMPGMLTTLFHNYLVSTDMLLMKSQPCPVCYEIKSAGIQNVFGMTYPMALGPITALMLAHRYGTYRVPDLTEGPKVMIKFMSKHIRPLSGTLIYMAAIQLAASSIITYFEMKNIFTLGQELSKIEEKALAAKGKKP